MAPHESCLIVTISFADNVEQDAFQYVPVGEVRLRVQSLSSGSGTKSEIRSVAMNSHSVEDFFKIRTRETDSCRSLITRTHI